MIKATLREVMKRKIDTTGHHVYLVRDGEVVFYVGQSQDVVKRLKQHLQKGRGQCITSAFGAFMNANRDMFRYWQAEFYTVEELMPLIQARRQKEFRHYWSSILPREQLERCERTLLDEPPTLDEAEGALIIACLPCFNVDWNATLTPIPNHYNTQLVIKSPHPNPCFIPDQMKTLFTIVQIPLKPLSVPSPSQAATEA